MAALLIGLAGHWLGRVLPPMPRPTRPVPLVAAAPAAGPMTTTTLENGKVVAVDTVPANSLPPDSEPSQETPSDTAVRFSTHDPLYGDTVARPQTYRRYLSILHGQAIIVQLLVAANAAGGSPAGSWYYRYGRHYQEHPLRFRHQRGPRLVLTEDATTDTAPAEWHLSWPLSRVLPGSRRAVYGPQRQVVQLHEDYSRAVPYELLRLTAYGSYCRAEPERPQPGYSTEYLHLLSADSVRLAYWQAPPPAARRNSLRREVEGACHQISQEIDVTLNDFDLLSYDLWTQSYYYSAHPEHDSEGYIIDLTTGQELLVEELLRPGTEPALLPLLARHLRQDYPEMTEEGAWHWEKVPPLPSSFILTPTGLQARYGDYALAGYVSHYANKTTIPYNELRPLIRPGTPLARMLQARGMW